MADQLPSKELFTDLSLLRASGFDDAAQEIERLRQEDRRWENAHKILLAEIERLKKQLASFVKANAELALGAETFACIGNCGASVPGPNAYCSACFMKARDEHRWYGGQVNEDAVREVVRLKRDIARTAVTGGRAAPEPDEAQSLLKCVYREVSDYAGVSEETMQAVELYLQRTLPPGAGQ